MPFFIAAPTTTLDADLPSGEGIEIEERPGSEVTHFQGRRVAAEGIEVRIVTATTIVQPCWYQE